MKKRRSGTLRGLAQVGTRKQPNGSTFGDILASLGDRSFGWGFVMGGLLNMLPLPPGSNLLLGLPLVFVSVQMALGRKILWMPDFITKRSFGREKWRAAALYVLPIARVLSRLTRRRMLWVFEGPAERLVGLLYVITSINLCVPIPFSGWLPAVCFFIVGVGLVEHDGLIVAAGTILCIVSLAVSTSMVLAIFFGFHHFLM